MQGIGSATLITVAVVLIADFWEAQARTRVLGFHAAAVSIGLLVTPLISGLVADYRSWRWSASIAVIALPLAAACHRLVPDNFSRGDLTVHQQLSTILGTLRRPGITAALSVNLVFAAGSFGVLLTAIPLYLDAEFGAGPGVRGAFLALSSLGGVAAGLGTARVRRAMNVRWTLTSAAGAMTACALVAGLTAAALLVAVSIFSFGVASGLANPTLQDFIASTVTPGERAAGLAALVSTMRLGQAIGPLLAGLLLRPLDPSAVVLVVAGVLGGLTLAISLDIVSTEKTR